MDAVHQQQRTAASRSIDIVRELAERLALQGLAGGVDRGGQSVRSGPAVLLPPVGGRAHPNRGHPNDPRERPREAPPPVPLVPHWCDSVHDRSPGAPPSGADAMPRASREHFRRVTRPDATASAVQNATGVANDHAARTEDLPNGGSRDAKALKKWRRRGARSEVRDRLQDSRERHLSPLHAPPEPVRAGAAEFERGRAARPRQASRAPWSCSVQASGTPFASRSASSRGQHAPLRCSWSRPRTTTTSGDAPRPRRSSAPTSCCMADAAAIDRALAETRGASRPRREHGRAPDADGAHGGAPRRISSTARSAWS